MKQRDKERGAQRKMLTLNIKKQNTRVEGTCGPAVSTFIPYYYINFRI